MTSETICDSWLWGDNPFREQAWRSIHLTNTTLGMLNLFDLSYLVN
jgi:hypothetical protein